MSSRFRAVLPGAFAIGTTLAVAITAPVTAPVTTTPAGAGTRATLAATDLARPAPPAGRPRLPPPSRIGTAIAGAVPDPTNWLMLVAGMGIAGVALRRRKRPQAVSG